MKRCTSCGVEKPLDAFHARKVGKGGRNSQCKACVLEYFRRWRHDNPDRIALYKKRQEKALLQAQRRWRERNPDKLRKIRQARLARIKEDPDERAKINARTRRWRENNPEKFRAQRAVENYRRREARVARRTDEAVRAYVFVLYRDPCCYCGAPATEIDHIVPYSKGGLTVWDNLTAACRTCNRRKHNVSLLRFLAA